MYLKNKNNLKEFEKISFVFFLPNNVYTTCFFLQKQIIYDIHLCEVIWERH